MASVGSPEVACAARLVVPTSQSHPSRLPIRDFQSAKLFELSSESGVKRSRLIIIADSGTDNQSVKWFHPRVKEATQETRQEKRLRVLPKMHD